MIFSVLAWAQAVETNGADNAGAKPAAPAMALDVFRNSRRVTERFRLCPPDVIVDLLAGAVGDFVDSTPEGWRPIPGTGVGGPPDWSDGDYPFGVRIMDMRNLRDNWQNCHTACETSILFAGSKYLWRPIPRSHRRACISRRSNARESSSRARMPLR